MNNYISTAPLYDSEYLAHYGIKGQKWGIRRFQNPDGTLTAEGLKRYGSVKELKKAIKEEYRKDQNDARRLGNLATQSAYAYKKQNKTVERAEKRLQKNPTDKNKRKLNIEKVVAKKLKEIDNQTKTKAENHYKTLVQKYGPKAIKDIKRTKTGEFNEKNGSGLWNTLSALGAMGMGYTTGFGVMTYRSSNKQLGGQLRDYVRYSEYGKNRPQQSSARVYNLNRNHSSSTRSAASRNRAGANAIRHYKSYTART